MVKMFWHVQIFVISLLVYSACVDLAISQDESLDDTILVQTQDELPNFKKDSFKIEVNVTSVDFLTDSDTSRCDKSYPNDDVYCFFAITICVLELNRKYQIKQDHNLITTQPQCTDKRYKGNKIAGIYKLKPGKKNFEYYKVFTTYHYITVQDNWLAQSMWHDFRLTLPEYENAEEKRIFAAAEIGLFFRNGTDPRDGTEIIEQLGDTNHTLSAYADHNDTLTKGSKSWYLESDKVTIDKEKGNKEHLYMMHINMKIDCLNHMVGDYCNETKSAYNGYAFLQHVQYLGNAASLDKCPYPPLYDRHCTIEITICMVVAPSETVIHENHDYIRNHCKGTKHSEHLNQTLNYGRIDHFKWKQNGTQYESLRTHKNYFEKASFKRPIVFKLPPFNYKTEKLVGIAEMGINLYDHGTVTSVGKTIALATEASRSHFSYNGASPFFSDMQMFKKHIPTSGYHDYIFLADKELDSNFTAASNITTYGIIMEMDLNCSDKYYGDFCDNFCMVNEPSYPIKYTHKDKMICDKKGCAKCKPNYFPNPDDIYFCNMNNKLDDPCSTACHNTDWCNKCGIELCPDGQMRDKPGDKCRNIGCADLTSEVGYDLFKHKSCVHGTCSNSEESSSVHSIRSYTKCKCDKFYEGDNCEIRTDSKKTTAKATTTTPPDNWPISRRTNNPKKDTTTAAPPPNPQPHTAAKAKSSSVKTILIVLFVVIVAAILAIVGYFMYKRSHSAHTNLGEDSANPKYSISNISKPSVAQPPTEDITTPNVHFKAAAKQQLASLQFDNPSYNLSAHDENV